jgi:hypothetical protein
LFDPPRAYILPSGPIAAATAARAVGMGAIVLQVLADGSYASAVLRTPVLLNPPKA